MMKNPSLRMATFAPEVVARAVRARLFAAIEVDPPFEQIVDGPGAPFDHVVDHGLVAESRPGIEGVLDVRVEAVLRVHDRGDPTLGVIGGGFRRSSLCDNRDAAVVGHAQGEMQPGNAAADHDKVKFQGCCHDELVPRVSGRRGRPPGARRPLAVISDPAARRQDPAAVYPPLPWPRNWDTRGVTPREVCRRVPGPDLASGGLPGPGSPLLSTGPGHLGKPAPSDAGFDPSRRF